MCANNASPMILNVLCRISLCGVLKIFHPCLCAISKSPLLNGSAMLALLGTLPSIWWLLLVSVVPCPMSSDDVVEWLVFACPFDNGMF